MEDATEANAVLEDSIDLDDGVVGLLRAAVRHVVDVHHHLLHPIPSPPPLPLSTPRPLPSPLSPWGMRILVEG